MSGIIIPILHFMAINKGGIIRESKKNRELYSKMDLNPFYVIIR